MIRLELPKPPSSNHLFPTGKNGSRHRSREYTQWLSNAEAVLWLNKFTHISGAVHIRIIVEDSGKVDLANHEKAVCDFCVKHHLIENDSRQFVRKITLEWGNVEGCIVEITEAK